MLQANQQKQEQQRQGTIVKDRASVAIRPLRSRSTGAKNRAFGSSWRGIGGSLHPPPPPHAFVPVSFDVCQARATAG